jgi:AraC-like DNA-binding protein
MGLATDEHLGDGADRRTLLRGYLSLIIAELERSLTAAGDGESESIPDTVVAAWAHICQHHDEDWSVDRMARRAAMGRSRFSALIRAHTGDSPVVALTRERLRAACRDLLETARSVTDIALDHGFGSSQAFAKVFRRYCLQTPSAYRSSGGLFSPRFASE